MKYVKAEIMVGIFMLLGIIAAVILALQVAGLVFSSSSDTYTVKAKFSNIGSLRLRAPVKVGGVLIGRVSKIDLDEEELIPVVYIDIQKRFNQLSSESRVAIQTAGIIGEQYITLTPGFYDEDIGTTYLKDGDTIADTVSALALEDLIGKFLYNSDTSSSKNDSDVKSE